jgi:predicted DNA-binding protein
MTVFQSRTNKHSESKKLVGVHLDKEDANRLAMLSLELEVPRTTILKDIINKYLEKQDTLPGLIDHASKRANRDWKKVKTTDFGFRIDQQNKVTSSKLKAYLKNKFKAYTKQVEADLKGHRIDKEIIEQIIEQIKAEI